MKPDYNYHTHTVRCHHAVGTDEEYVLAAIDAGIKVLGFADHVFVPGIRDRRSRGDYSELEGYIDSINALKAKYADQIEIHLGFEAEYVKALEGYYRELLDSGRIEYLIQGQHCTFNPARHTTLYYLQYLSGKGMRRYVDDLIAGMESGLYSYVAHPDYFAHRIHPGKPLFDEYSREILSAAEALRIPLEINLGHHTVDKERNEDRFATRRFFELAGEYDVSVIIGSAAHDPKDFRITDYDYAYTLIKDYGLKEITRLPMK